MQTTVYECQTLNFKITYYSPINSCDSLKISLGYKWFHFRHLVTFPVTGQMCNGQDNTGQTETDVLSLNKHFEREFTGCSIVD